MKVVEFPKDDVEFYATWHTVAGRVAALKECIGVLKSASANAFGNRKDEIANVLRDLADEMELRRKDASIELEAYISESFSREKKDGPRG